MKKQDNPIYSMIENTNERHIKWLLKNYGEPTDKNLGNYLSILKY